MSDARWVDVEDDLDQASRHFRHAGVLYRTGTFDRSFEGERDSMALMHFLQSGYNCVEQAMLRLLAILAEDSPSGEGWHRGLVNRLARPMQGAHARQAIVSPEIAVDLHEALSFRHRAIHNYAGFDATAAAPAVAAAERLALSLQPAIAGFRALVDPDT